MSGTDLHQVLIAEVGTIRCAIPIEHVVETLRPLPVEPIGRGPSYVRGMAIIRGEPTLVLDAAELLGTTAETKQGTPRRFVVVRTADRKAALIVDSVTGIRGISEGELGALPPLARHAQSDVIAAIGAVDNELVVVLEAARLIPAEVAA